jgi:hypothetical protein
MPNAQNPMDGRTSPFLKTDSSTSSVNSISQSLHSSHFPSSASSTSLDRQPTPSQHTSSTLIDRQPPPPSQYHSSFLHKDNGKSNSQKHKSAKPNITHPQKYAHYFSLSHLPFFNSRLQRPPSTSESGSDDDFSQLDQFEKEMLNSH